MSDAISRREFIGASVGAAAAAALAPHVPAGAAPARPSREPLAVQPDVEPVVRLLEETPRDKLIPAVVDELRRGLPYRLLLAGAFMAQVRGGSSHGVWVIHSIHQMCQDVDHEDRLYPILWGLGPGAGGSDPFVWRIDDKALPPAGKAEALFEAGMEKRDVNAAQAGIVALARSEGPERAMDRLWRWGAIGSGGNNIGHHIIGIANTYRTLEVIGWRHAEPVLQYIVFADQGSKGEVELSRANSRQAKDVLPKLRPDWTGGKSDRGAVLELLGFFREGAQRRACEWAGERLAAGKLQAATVWDAVFLGSAELVVRFQLGGVTGRPLHSMTMANALHCAFRKCAEPEARLRVLLEAIHWGCAFYAVERGRGHLRDLRITAIPEVDSPKSVADAVEDVFARLPPRRQGHRMRDRSGDDKAMELTYALARRHPHGPFFQTARRLLCRKADGSHDMKFAVAVFENYEHVSPEWRPHLMAASAHCLHGPRMEDSTSYLQSREALRRLK